MRIIGPLGEITMFTAIQILAALVLFCLSIAGAVKGHYAKKTAQLKKQFPDPLFVINTFNGVTAICKRADFMDALNEYTTSAKTDSRKQAEVVEIEVPNTPTFYSDLKFQRLAHAGSVNDFEDIMLAMLSEISNQSVDSWKRNQLYKKEVLKEVFITCDPRLFVPFCNNGMKPSYNAANFSIYNLSQAHGLIMDTVKGKK